MSCDSNILISVLPPTASFPLPFSTLYVLFFFTYNLLTIYSPCLPSLLLFTLSYLFYLSISLFSLSVSSFYSPHFYSYHFFSLASHSFYLFFHSYNLPSSLNLTSPLSLFFHPSLILSTLPFPSYLSHPYSPSCLPISVSSHYNPHFSYFFHPFPLFLPPFFSSSFPLFSQLTHLESPVFLIPPTYSSLILYILPYTSLILPLSFFFLSPFSTSLISHYHFSLHFFLIPSPTLFFSLPKILKNPKYQ